MESQWKSIDTLKLEDRVAVLRPHVNWGTMAVVWLESGHRIKMEPRAGEVFHWFSVGYGVSWPDDAFEPYWMELPAPPKKKPLQYELRCSRCGTCEGDAANLESDMTIVNRDLVTVAKCPVCGEWTKSFSIENKWGFGDV